MLVSVCDTALNCAAAGVYDGTHGGRKEPSSPW